MSRVTHGWSAVLELPEVVEQGPRAPHTVVLDQVAEVNTRLAVVGNTGRLCAGALGLTGAPILVRHDGVFMPAARPQAYAPAAALLSSVSLRHVHFQGDPEFPYLFGEFAGSLPVTSDGGVVALHTDTMRSISLALGFQGHRWGTA